MKNLSLKYDVIHDALKVICDKILKRPREFGDIWVIYDDMDQRYAPPPVSTFSWFDEKIS